MPKMIRRRSRTIPITKAPIEIYLEHLKTPKYFVFSNVLYTQKDIEYFRLLCSQYGSTNFSRIIHNESINDYKFYPFLVECKCNDCGCTDIQKFNKTQFTKYITAPNSRRGRSYEFIYICNECEQKRKLQNKLQQQEQNKKLEENRQKRLNYYINNVCDPECQWNKGTSVYTKMNEVKELLPHPDCMKVIQTHLLSLTYQQFLQTPYWKAIAEYKKKQANYKCKLCNSDHLLNVHHSNYNIRGLELSNMNDLIVLCNSCHAKFHDKGSYNGN